MDASDSWRKNTRTSRSRHPSSGRAGDESKTAEGEIVVIERDPRSKSEAVPSPPTGDFERQLH
jgi:hypothetical protein